MEVEIAGALAQFGVAGLVCWMWLTERRAAGGRERQVDELHGRLMGERRELDVLVAALGDNTRALASMEATQRGMVSILNRWSDQRGLGREAC